MKTKLSALAIRRQTFVLAILEGRSADDAARAAGYKGKDANMRIRAWELLRHADIKAKLQELAKQTATDTIATITQRLERLSEILLGNNPGDAIKAIHEMNLMQRIYTLGVNVNVQQNMTAINATTEGTREKLLKLLTSVSARIERTGSGAIESDDIGSREKDGCSEEQNNKSSEVADE